MPCGVTHCPVLRLKSHLLGLRRMTRTSRHRGNRQRETRHLQPVGEEAQKYALPPWDTPREGLSCSSACRGCRTTGHSARPRTCSVSARTARAGRRRAGTKTRHTRKTNTAGDNPFRKQAPSVSKHACRTGEVGREKKGETRNNTLREAGTRGRSLVWHLATADPLCPLLSADKSDTDRRQNLAFEICSF